MPASDDQKRRVRNTTQDRKAMSKLNDSKRTATTRAEDTTSWGPEELLGTTMDENGNPVPDPVSFSHIHHDHIKSGKNKKTEDNDDMDLYEAMTADFD